MSSEIIDFKRHRAFRRAQLYREQPVPRSTFQSVTLARSSGGALPSTIAFVGRFDLVERQMRRIATLLDELKEFAGSADALPPATVERARLLMNRADDVLQGWAAINNEAALEDDADPQPELDNEKMERMYRSLYPDV